MRLGLRIPWRRDKRLGIVDAQGPSLALESSFQRGVPHFRRGEEEVHLPNFVVALIRTPSLAPTNARFRVPLWFSKLDLRDFLYHGYHVRAFNIRSSIKQWPIELYHRTNSGGTKMKYSRRRAMKTMTIEMDEPFYWPDPPAELQLGPDDKCIATAESDAGGFNVALFRQQRESSARMQETRRRQVPWIEGSDNLAMSTARLNAKEGTGKRSGEAIESSLNMPTVADLRNTYAAEAEKLLAGRIKWQPTWKSMQEHMFLAPRDGSKLRRRNPQQ